MKDVIISGRRIRRELWMLGVSFAAAYALNVFSIIHWSRPLSELYSTLGYVVTLALGIYLSLLVIRLLVFGCIRIVRHFTGKK